MLKELVPGVTVNSRLRSDEYGKRHFDSNGHLMGDYESGYERRLPDAVKDLQVPRRDWEACMTIPENQWGYHKDWSLSYVKKNCRGYRAHRTCRIHGGKHGCEFWAAGRRRLPS
ncbi:MAG: hypothetical protein ACLTSL_11180 [Odoribacter splanchnicus]